MSGHLSFLSLFVGDLPFEDLCWCSDIPTSVRLFSAKSRVPARSCVVRATLSLDFGLRCHPASSYFVAWDRATLSPCFELRCHSASGYVVTRHQATLSLGIGLRCHPASSYIVTRHRATLSPGIKLLCHLESGSDPFCSRIASSKSIERSDTTKEKKIL